MSDETRVRLPPCGSSKAATVVALSSRSLHVAYYNLSNNSAATAERQQRLGPGTTCDPVVGEGHCGVLLKGGAQGPVTVVTGHHTQNQADSKQQVVLPRMRCRHAHTRSDVRGHARVWWVCDSLHVMQLYSQEPSDGAMHLPPFTAPTQCMCECCMQVTRWSLERSARCRLLVLRNSARCIHSLQYRPVTAPGCALTCKRMCPPSLPPYLQRAVGQQVLLQ
jgi:hypothetical protein